MKSTKVKIMVGCFFATMMALVACNNGGTSKNSNEAKPSNSGDVGPNQQSSSNVDQSGDQPSESASTNSSKQTPPIDTNVKYNVTFNYGDNNKQTSEIARGSALTKPTDPVAPAGMSFYGWKNTLNGGQIWDFEHEDLNLVMADINLEPVFITDYLSEQRFEAETCPAITAVYGQEYGMPGATYSGGQQGKGLIGRDYDQVFGTTGIDEYSCAYVHFMYIKGDTLTWELESDVDVDNVTLFARFSAEYGLVDSETDERYSTISDKSFPIKVNDQRLEYGTITFHAIPDIGQILYFQDYFISASISLRAGSNKIEMIVDNDDTLNGTIASSAPCIDSIKLYADCDLTWPDECFENLERD